jgi:aldehyde dehydrogenase (NAD+)
MTAIDDATGLRPERAGDAAPSAEAPEPHDALVGRLRAAHAAGVTRPPAWRRAQLEAMRRLLVERETELLEALAADLGKPAIEGWMTELRHVSNEITHILAHLGAWTAPEKVAVRAVLQPARATIVPEPLGVALVIAPWNYPLHLLLLPMAYALAAGNAVVGKPSEISPHTAAALSRLVPQYLDRRATAIVEGDAPVVTSLLEQRWDHIFYTGNGRVGRIVMAAAARHLTPVTLELGGKSPVIVDRSANLDVAARRIVWGKFVNAGQTCVAPDYVLVERSVAADLTAAMVRAVRSSYGDDPQRSPDYPRIINERHFDRLVDLLDRRGDARVAVGGASERADRYLAPTILTGVSWTDPVMAEEIFGPILPVLEVDDLDAAIATVNAHDKPLALYVFAERRAVVDTVVAATSSGGVCANGTLLHLAVTDLPFGGVGESGMGAYHGRTGFDTFSHRKAVLARGTRLDPPVMYPPYTRVKQWLLRRAF